MNEHDDSMIVLTTGKADRGTRATLAFSWACSSAAMGLRTSLFLTMDGSSWAVPGATRGVQVAGFEPLEQYLESFLALGGRLLVCAPCTEFYCDRDSHNGGQPRLLDGAELVGLATVVSLTGSGSRIVTF